VLSANLRDTQFTAGHAESTATKHHEEVHPVNTSTRIVFDTKINVLHNTKPKIPRVGKILALQFVFFHFQATLQNFQSFVSSHRHVHRNLLITADTERAHSVSGFRVNRLLSCKLLKHTGSASEPIAGLANATVENQLLNTNLSLIALLSAI